MNKQIFKFLRPNKKTRRPKPGLGIKTRIYGIIFCVSFIFALSVLFPKFAGAQHKPVKHTATQSTATITLENKTGQDPLPGQMSPPTNNNLAQPSLDPVQTPEATNSSSQNTQTNNSPEPQTQSPPLPNSGLAMQSDFPNTTAAGSVQPTPSPSSQTTNSTPPVTKGNPKTAKAASKPVLAMRGPELTNILAPVLNNWTGKSLRPAYAADNLNAKPNKIFGTVAFLLFLAGIMLLIYRPDSAYLKKGQNNTEMSFGKS